MQKHEVYYRQKISVFTKPKRRALSVRYPVLKPIIIRIRQWQKKLGNKRHIIARKHADSLYPNILARHQSVLLRTLGDSNMQLQYNKVQNIRRACQDIDGLIIQPGEVFSLWETIGKPTSKRGYIKGMLLSEGKVIEGIGGGLCQLSNFLCWILLHANTKIIERYHHSRDVFPNSGRVLPFGSGATCLYNFVDLQIQNVGNTPLQLHLWLTNKHLKGQVRSTEPSRLKYHIQEKNHTFIQHKDVYYRSNELWRITKEHGKILHEELLFNNFAPVLYPVTPEYLSKHNYTCLHL